MSTNKFVNKEYLLKQLKLYKEKILDMELILRSEMGVPGGVATLDANGRLPVEQLPTKLAVCKGVWDCSSGNFPSTVGMEPGYYYRVGVAGTLTETRSDITVKAGRTFSAFEISLIAQALENGVKITVDGTNTVTSVTASEISYEGGSVTLPDSENNHTLTTKTPVDFSWDFEVGDWILFNDDGEWQKLDNNDAVTSVNGQSGEVDITGDTLKATYENETDALNTILTKVGKVKTVNSQTPDANGNILLDGSNINATYEGTTDTINTLLTQLGGSDIFTGTQAEWDALTTAEKNEYSQANITDSSSTVFIPVDTVADGNMNPVTSNAVYDVFAEIGTELRFNLGPWSVQAGYIEDTKTIGTLPAGTWIVFIQSLGTRTNLYASVDGNRVTTSSRLESADSNGFGYGVVRLTNNATITATVITNSSTSYDINGDGYYHNVTAIRIA